LEMTISFFNRDLWNSCERKSWAVNHLEWSRQTNWY
jgi:hypothetical protein